VFLQAGAFGGYDGIYKGQAGAPPGNVTEVACFAHARRKFYDARGSDAATSTQALAWKPARKRGSSAHSMTLPYSHLRRKVI
jgi:hypothetical protein